MRSVSLSSGRQVQLGGEGWVMPSFASSLATASRGLLQPQLLPQLVGLQPVPSLKISLTVIPSDHPWRDGLCMRSA